MEMINLARRVVLKRKRPVGKVPPRRITPKGALGGMDPGLRVLGAKAFQGRSYYKGAQ